MKILGHPVHIMLVHFPSAQFPMDLACSIINYYPGKSGFLEASFYAMCGGTVIGWLAMIFGFFDLLKVYESKPAVMKYALIHGGINGTVILIYSILTFIQYKRYPVLEADTMALLIIKGLTISIMIIGNFIGGSLILKHKVSVE